jgi:hypothetical protein
MYLGAAQGRHRPDGVRQRLPLDDPGYAIETVKSLRFGDAELEAGMHDNAAAQFG